MKRVLIIKMGPWETLEASNIRALAMAKGILDLGYEIDWIGVKAPYEYPLLNRSEYDFLDRINFIMLDNQSLHIAKRYSGNVLLRKYHKICHRIASRFSIYDYYKKIAEAITVDCLEYKDYDYLVSISDSKTSHLAAKNLINSGKLKARKWIEYWGDPMVNDISRISVAGVSRLKKGEKKLFSNCDKIVYTSPCTLRDERTLHPEYEEKMSIVPTPCIEDLSHYEDDGIFTIGYYGVYREEIVNIMPLYNACRKLGKGYRLNIVGNGIPLEPAENIRISPRGDISEYKSSTDLYACILKHKGSQLPLKVYNCAVTNRPVLVVLDGENKNAFKEYLEEFNRYWFCENNEVSIIDTIKRIERSTTENKPCKSFEPVKVADIFLR